MLRRAVSLIEALLVIAIIAALAGMSIPIYRTYQVRNDLNLATEQVVQGLGRAKLLAQAAQGDSSWGFYVPGGVLYQGEDYESRDPAFDEVYPMPSSIAHAGQLFEVSFSKLEGTPSHTGTIKLIAFTGEQREVVVQLLVSEEEVAVEGGGGSSTSSSGPPYTVCHKPGTYHENTLYNIQEGALTAHLAHGDEMGECPSPSGGAISCPYSLAVDGTIQMSSAGNFNLAVYALGTDLKYGCETQCLAVPVFVKYTEDGGGQWKKLFNDDEIGPIPPPKNDTKNINQAATYALQFHGYLEEGGLLRFDRTVATNDSSDGTIILRNGDPLPAFLPPAATAALAGMLQEGNRINPDNTINAPGCDLVVLAELSDLGYPLPPSEDFTDAVMYLDFPATP